MVGDWVWLKLQPYRQQSVQLRSNQKLSPKYYGPYQIQVMIGKVAYKLKLPTSAMIHDIYHVSQLKLFYGTLPMATHIPVWFHGQDATAGLKPTAILDMRIVKVHNQAQVQYLVQWEGFPASESYWEVAVDFENKFPDFLVG